MSACRLPGLSSTSESAPLTSLGRENHPRDLRPLLLYSSRGAFYPLAFGRMGRYEECRSMVEIVLRMDPDMPAAQTLHKAVQEATARRSESTSFRHFNF